MTRSNEWYRKEAGKHEREKERRHEARVSPRSADVAEKAMHKRRTAWRADPDETLNLDNGWQIPTASYPIATLWAYRYEAGIALGGVGSIEQLRELRNAINARIAQAEGEQ